MNFIKLLKQSKVSINQVDDFVDEWHNNNSLLELYKYLGLTKQEYINWCFQGNKYLKKFERKNKFMMLNSNDNHQSPFHAVPIQRGVYGELSKIQEELNEAFDAEARGQELMMLIELADIIGAVEGVSKKYGFSIEQLVKYSRLRSEVAIKERVNSNGN